ncbi:MAG TPA: GatB/YqeY domain-containing protein [Bacteroidota bacterium]|jgi:uncharacterized protein YqeY
MTLKDKISSDLKLAMKSGDKLRLETLRSLRAVLMEKEIEKRGPDFKGLKPEDELAAVSTAAKKRRESIEQFEKGGREDLAQQERSELQIIQEYLPEQMSGDDVKAHVRGVIASAGAEGQKDFGKVMPVVMKELKGKADGRVIQEIVKELLGGNQ